MKLLIRDYVASLRERQELDAILPDLLSEIGFHVFSRPGIGATQRGVDIAAVGRDRRGKEKVYLFCVKAGDLTRQDWDGNSQAMRSSLDEILDEYIPNWMPPAYRTMAVVIVICLGGDVHQTVRSLVSAFTRKHSTRRITFEEWNGDRIAELLIAGILREKTLPKELQSHFQKAVAMADQPEVSYDQFARLIFALRQAVTTDKDRVRVARQIYLCLWVLFAWARDVDNLDAPYRASECALLNVWELTKPFIGKNTAYSKAVLAALHHLILLHVQIASLFLNTKIAPYVMRLNALSIAVQSHESVDVTLKMFEVLGRLALTGHWIAWLATFRGTSPHTDVIKSLQDLAVAGVQLISNNPSLFSPVKDEQSIDVALFLCFATQVGTARSDLAYWLSEMARRLRISVISHGKYPCVFRDYQDLIDHPKQRTDEYRNEATSGSTLIPLICAWLAGFGDKEALANLVELMAGVLKHCTLQLWLPEAASEKHLYLNDEIHGVALTDLAVSEDGQALLKIVVDACQKSDGFSALSAVACGYSPLVLTACRHYRLPVPPQYWIAMLVPIDPITPES